MLERPGAGGAFRDHHVPRFNGVQDATAIEYRIGGLDRIVVAFRDMALEMFELSAELNFEVSPGGCRHDLPWLESV